MNDQTIAEIILAVIIVVGIFILCIIGAANIKALKRIEESEKLLPKFAIKKIKYGKGDHEYEVRFDDFIEVIGIGDTKEEAIAEAFYNLKAYLNDLAKKERKETV